MNKGKLAGIFLAITILWLSGCGGGGGGGVGRVDPDSTPVVSGPAASVPVVSVFTPWPHNTRRLLHPDNDEHTITGFEWGGEDGYNVTYESEGRRRSINLSDDAGTGYFTFQDEDLAVGLNFIGGDDRHSFLSEDFEQLSIVSFRADVDEDFFRGYLVHGNRTGADNLPLGSVTYFGKLMADRESADTSDRHGRARVTGDVKLSADFATDTLEGTIDRMYVRQSPLYHSEYIPDARFVIDSGWLTGNVFVANARGYGEFLDGYSGSVDGRFFGQEAEEFGGVLGVSQRGSFLYGYIVGSGGEPPSPPSEDPLSPLISMNYSVVHDAWKRAAKAYPYYRGSPSPTGSITQSTSGSNVETRFDGERLRVTVRKQSDGSQLTFDTGRDARIGGLNNSVLWKESDRTASVAVLGVDWTDPAGSDYLAGGTWIHLKGRDPQTSKFSDAEVGTFVDGPALATPASFSVPSNYSGVAQYIGRARGIYSIQHGSGFGETPSGSHASGAFTGHFRVDVEATGRPSGACLGCGGHARVNGGDILLDGVVTDGETGEETEIVDQPAPFRLQFWRISSTGRIWGEGSDTSRPDHPFEEGSNPRVIGMRWGEKVSGVSEIAGIGSMPQRVVGTFGVADTLSEDSQVLFLGNYEAFGPWENELDASLQFSLNAGGGVLAYGIGTIEGAAGAWYLGPSPTNWFNNNELYRRRPGSHPTDSLTWSGHMWGFTPTSDTVRGEAELSINISWFQSNFEEPTGLLDVTALEWWSSAVQPGPAGSGRTWHDGDLRYLVEVREDDNQFRSIGSHFPEYDAGQVYGQFFGGSHEAVGGAIYRDDLTAVFAGRR